MILAVAAQVQLVSEIGAEVRAESVRHAGQDAILAVVARAGRQIAAVVIGRPYAPAQIHVQTSRHRTTIRQVKEAVVIGNLSQAGYPLELFGSERQGVLGAELRRLQ